MTDFKLMPTKKQASLLYLEIDEISCHALDALDDGRVDRIYQAIWSAMCEAAPSPWRPIEEAPEMEDVLAWPVNGRIGVVWFEDGSRPHKHARGWHERDTFREIDAPTHFIPLDALGIPGGGDE